MSDTPRTDAELIDAFTVPADCARQLEREAAAWKRWLREHLIAHYSARAAAGEIPATQVTILTDMAMNEAAAFCTFFRDDE
jgi:hypothetical protein